MKQFIRNNRLIDRKPENNSQWLCPLLNIDRSIKVAITGIPARVTMEKSLITNTNLSTYGAGLGSIFWANSHKTMTIPYCLIFNELPQLEPAPIRDCSIKYSSPIAFSYSCQVLHNKNGTDILCFYNLFADDVVHIPSETFLSARQSFEMFLGRLCSFALEPCFKASEPINMMFDITEEPFIAGYSNMIYAEVNTNNVSDRANIDVNLFSNAKMEIEISTSKEQFAFSNVPINIPFEIIWDFDWQFNPTVDSAYAQDIVLNGEASWWVVSDASIEKGFVLCIDTAFISPLDSSCNELGLEFWKFSSEFSIDSIIEIEIGTIMLPANINGIVNSFRIERKSLSYSEIIFKLDFDYSSVFHSNMEEEQIYKLIGNEENANLLIHIPPTTKDGGLPVAIGK